MLVCPVCERPLAHDESAFRCPAGHSFDRAREGYVNLLRVPYPGDTRAMLRARRAFLDAGHYRPLSTAINERVATHLTDRRGGAAPAAILDAGCGEGYYVGALDVYLRAHLSDVTLCSYGLDVAKEAARLAARRYPTVTFLVANLKARLPFADASLDALLDVFAPRNPAGFARVLAPGGLLLAAIPAPGHLAEARSAFSLLAIEAEKERHILAQLAPAFSLTSTATLEYPLTLAGTDLACLIAMSPSSRHISVEAYERAARTERFTTLASFTLLAFTRR